MGEKEILDKLTEVFRKPLTEEGVVYILSRVRKILEIKNEKKEKSVLNFHCNLALHSRINNVPEEILNTFLNLTIDRFLKLKENEKYTDPFTTRFNDFHKELKAFIKENKLPVFEYDFKSFNELLFKIYSHTPIILNDKWQVITDPRGGISMSPYKTILVDAVNTFVIENGQVFKEMKKLLEKYQNKKIILTNANKEEKKKFGLTNLPYPLFSLDHNPDKINPEYFRKMLVKFELTKDNVVYFEHNLQAVKSAQSVGINSYHYDDKKRDLSSLEKFLDENLQNY